MDKQTACLLAVSLYLTLHSGQSQSTQPGPWKRAQPILVRADPGAEPPASFTVLGRYEEEERTYIIPQTYAPLGKDSKLSIFIAAAVGTMTLMGVVYCIYSQFYSKRLFSHAQLDDDTELMLDLPESPSSSSSSSSFFCRCHAPTDGEKKTTTSQAGYGSVSDRPSIINVPPVLLSTPPLAAPFNPLSLSSPAPLQTISAQNLERGFV